MLTRCTWCGTDPYYVAYHDAEWGVPVRADQPLFALLCLESMQAGLNWLTILKKRRALFEAFAAFEPERLVQMTDQDLQRLQQLPGIIRHAGKIQAVVNNARCYLKLQAHTSFAQLVWQFTDGQVIQQGVPLGSPLPMTSPPAQAMARWLKSQGFQFIGEKICYAYMQAAGMVNDHAFTCFRYRELGGQG